MCSEVRNKFGFMQEVKTTARIPDVQHLKRHAQCEGKQSSTQTGREKPAAAEPYLNLITSRKRLFAGELERTQMCVVG